MNKSEMQEQFYELSYYTLTRTRPLFTSTLLMRSLPKPRTGIPNRLQLLSLSLVGDVLSEPAGAMRNATIREWCASVCQPTLAGETKTIRNRGTVSVSRFNMVQSHTRNILACLTLLFCFSFNAFHVVAQDLEILSKRPPVVKTFDHKKNESTIHAFLFNPDALQNLFDPNRVQPNMRLHSASYTYPGTTKARPQSMTFVIQPLNKHKTAPHFSFTADGTVVLEGETTLSELCCVEIYGQSHTNQHIVVSVPAETFERMTQAKKIELKISSKNDNRSFKLNDDQRKSLTALANTMK